MAAKGEDRALAPGETPPPPPPLPFRRLRAVARAGLLAGCFVVLVIQLTECFRKLTSPPVSTHTHVGLNTSVAYPAVTVCRTPAYRSAVLAKYGLTDVTTSEWLDFPHEEVTLEDFWNEATYNQSEVFAMYRLHQVKDNLVVTPRTFLRSGRCFTLKPEGEEAAAPEDKDKEVGYSLMLGNARGAHGDVTSGWALYLHQPHEPFIEDGGHRSGRSEHIYVEVGEEIHVKVSVTQYEMLDRPEQPCNSSHHHSYVQCAFQCHWKRLADTVGCSAPWLPVDDLPHCNNSDQHWDLIRKYLNVACELPCCDCRQRCRTDEYRAFVVKRQTFSSTASNHSLSQLYLFFSTKMVIHVVEHYAYDWSLFLADAGGSLGFLLGLSVVGAVEAVEAAVRAARPGVRRAAAAASNVLARRRRAVLPLCARRVAPACDAVVALK